MSLLVTELVSNGVRHAGTNLELRLSFDGGCLRIAVTDGDPRLPERPLRQATPPSRPDLAVGGWGLALVESLSTEWGTDPLSDGGKTVWFEIDTTERGPSGTVDR